jgi:4'-phosphopantetheinyl transferase
MKETSNQSAITCSITIWSDVMIEIYAVNVSVPLENSFFQSLTQFVSEEKEIKISRCRNREDAERTLIAELLIRGIVCKKFAIHNDQIYFTVNEYGKPLLPWIPNFHFNLSHSGDWVVCAVSEYPIGVDIELIKPIDLAIANRFFTKKEIDFIMSEEEVNRIPTFYDLWSLKESYIKALGKGLSMPLDSFTILPGQNEIKLESTEDNKEESFFFKQYHIDPRYKLSVCTQENSFPTQVVFLTALQILACFC